MTQPVHASVVSFYMHGQWRGVLIRGHSGSGKSDLALRLISAGARLVVDDQAIVWNSQGGLYATAPATIAGKIEVRGLGILSQPYLPVTRIWLVIDAATQTPERYPEPVVSHLHGVSVPSLFVQLTHASATQVVTTALEAL